MLASSAHVPLLPLLLVLRPHHATAHLLVQQVKLQEKLPGAAAFCLLSFSQKPPAQRHLLQRAALIAQPSLLVSEASKAEGLEVPSLAASNGPPML